MRFPGTDKGGDVLRGARHDFKTPLTSLRMIAQMFELAARENSLAKEPARIQRNAQMMVGLVDKLSSLADLYSDIALIESGHFKLQPVNCDLRPLVQDAVNKAGGHVGLSLPEAPLIGMWDVRQLEQALAHLISQLGATSVEIAKPEGGNGLMIKFVRPTTGARPSLDTPWYYFSRHVLEGHHGFINEDFQVFLPLSDQGSKK